MDPGTVHSEISYNAKKGLSELSREELVEYKSALDLIASKYKNIDTRLSACFNIDGKLSMIEQVLKKEKS